MIYIFSVGLKLYESCNVDAQCTGIPNAGLCMADSNEIHNPTCRCSTGYIRYKERCLKGTDDTKLIFT